MRMRYACGEVQRTPTERKTNLVPSTVKTAVAQDVSFSVLIDCNLNDDCVRKILKTQVRYEIPDDLQLQSTEGSGNRTAVHMKTTLGQGNV